MALNRPSEYLTEEDDIMIAPWAMAVIKSFLAGRGIWKAFAPHWR